MIPLYVERIKMEFYYFEKGFFPSNELFTCFGGFSLSYYKSLNAFLLVFFIHVSMNVNKNPRSTEQNEVKGHAFL